VFIEKFVEIVIVYDKILYMKDFFTCLILIRFHNSHQVVFFETFFVTPNKVFAFSTSIKLNYTSLFEKFVCPFTLYFKIYNLKYKICILEYKI